ncbi:MAG: hypothetical protein ABH828_02715 [archaeon]
MNKKGDEKMSSMTMYRLGILIFSALLVLALFSFVKNTFEDTTFWRNYYAKDIGLLMDTMFAERGDVEINYDYTRAGKLLDLRVSEDYVMVQEFNSEKEDSQRSPSTFRYAKDLNSPIFNPGPWNYVKLTASNFKIVKTGSTIEFLTETEKSKLCSAIDTYSKPEETTIYIISEEKNIANILKSGLKNEGFTAETSFEKEITSIMDQSMNFAINVSSTDEKVIVFYYTGELEKAEKLTCIIEKRLFEKYPNIFSTSFLEKMSDEEIKEMGYPKLGLKIKLFEMSTEKAIEITEGVVEYYG